MSTNNSESKKVFISYIRENFDEIDRICKKLDEEGIGYWIDHNDIDPGKYWKKAIKNAISNGAYFIACFSKEYNEKSATYMNEEILVAIEVLRTMPFDSGLFIPIKLSECEIPDIDIGAGYTLKDIHYLKFHEDWDAQIKRLIDMIKREEDLSQPDIPEDFFKKQYIYQGLKSLIEIGEGTGFHNADLGHPVYVMGATGKVYEGFEYADSPEKNVLFKMLSDLSIELKKLGIEEYRFIWWHDFTEWKDFCRFAVDVYNENR